MLASRAEGRIVTAAEFMGRPMRFLEAWRSEIYRDLPVPDGWHEAYARGEANTAPFRRWRNWEADEEDGPERPETARAGKEGAGRGEA